MKNDEKIPSGASLFGRGASWMFNTEESRSYWEEAFAREDPWNYDSPYEQLKYERTLSLLADEPIGSALELACAEGRFSAMLAPHVKRLYAVDISQTALDRARTRCADFSNVTFGWLNFFNDPLPGKWNSFLGSFGKWNLIVCSEVLYYVGDPQRLAHLASKICASLELGGRLIMAHAHHIADDPNQTGFDWEEHDFGCATIARVFSETPGLKLERAISTDLYRIELYRRVVSATRDDRATDVLPVPLGPLVEFPAARSIVWGGAVMRRCEARARETTERIPVLMYHRVADCGPESLARYRISPAQFEEQLRALRRHGYHPIGSDELLGAARLQEPLRGRPIMITFDDGYQDFLENAWPLLEKYDFFAEVFIVTDFVGGRAEWDAHCGEPAPLMSWEAIKWLQDRGIRFGSHLATHRAAESLPAEEVLREGVRARETLERQLGRNITSLAMPFGGGNEALFRSLATCGYHTQFSTQNGFATVHDWPLNFPRIEICGDDDIASFGGKIERLLTS